MQDCHISKNPYTEWGMSIVSRVNGLGRTLKWLSDTLNVTPPCLSKILHGKSYISEKRIAEIEDIIKREEKSRAS